MCLREWIMSLIQTRKYKMYKMYKIIKRKQIFVNIFAKSLNLIFLSITIQNSSWDFQL